MRVVLLLAAAAVALPGLARAEGDPACARFEEPLAYNACLASHGPKARDIGTRPGRTVARGVETDGASRAATPYRAPAAAHVTRRHGRTHMEFRLR
jgi:hypothetical protein